eukprot:2713306-Ditylum_brightwellii.AAC.1
MQLNALDKHQGEDMRAAEKCCRKLKMGIVDYSPEKQNIKAEWIKCLAWVYGITQPLSSFLSAAVQSCGEALACYLEAKPNHATACQAFLSGDLSIPIEKRKVEAEQAVQSLINRETSWGEAVVTVNVMENESITMHTQKQSVEENIVSE